MVESAFGFAGQKCSALSRLIVLDHAYDAVVPRVIQAVAELADRPPGPHGHPGRAGDRRRRPPPPHQGDRGGAGPRHAGPHPLRAARRRLVRRADRRDRRRSRARRSPPTSCSGRCSPSSGSPTSTAPSQLANDTDYALTAGIFSRSPATIRRAAAELRAGNVYVNRGITGAVVGRQPFGGYGLSGVGLEGRRPRLPAPVRRPPHPHREHAAARLRTRGLGIREDG